MLDLKCRLCSSDRGLISLSGGKCRKNRDYIRKLVESTTGIKFEKDDFHKYICYPCTIQVYNFYLFKAKSLENENTLEAHIKKNKKNSPNKIQIRDLSNITLPDPNELQEILAPWLISKLQYCEPPDNECLKNTEANETSEHISTNNIKETVQSQLRKEVGVDVSVECDLPKSIVDKSTQSNPSSACVNKYTQCVVLNAPVYTQTNDIVTKSCKIQCCLLTEGRGSRISATLPKPKGVDKGTQYYDVCKNCKETDCKSCLYNLVNIKQEPQLSMSINLSTTNALIEDRSKIISPIPFASTPISNSFGSENQIICKMCEKTLVSKESYVEHKKQHMMCRFCRKRFSSMKRAIWHEHNDCHIGKVYNQPIVIQLNRLENIEGVQKNYPKCLEDWRDFERRRKMASTVRMRSRSTSSAESYSCCSFCRNSVTVLQGVKLGIDKSVQTNLIGDGILPGLVNGDVIVKSRFRNVGSFTSPAKRRKLSSSLIG